MKKTLALVLALAMVFSTITVAFAEDTLGEDAQICADLGMLKGETGTVDAAYAATAPERYQAAIMFLRLKGLEAEALAFTGEDNFADGNLAWAEGANMLAYLKANPQLGWIGDGTNFNPNKPMTAQEYYKVLLEALGYKQTTAEVAGDFTWEEVLTFAASVGLSKVAAAESFTVNDLAVATVEALKVNVKDTEKTLAATLVEAGVVDEAKAAAAGLVEDVPAAVAAELKEAKATGNAVVEVTFKAAVDEAAENVANYAIEGLEVNSAAISGSKTVVLGTAAMTSGKIYKLTVGEKTVQFTGVAKVSGGPAIDDVVSEDVEEVVITFDKNVDLATGSDVANYSIAGVEIVEAEVDEDEVTLTTEGLKNKTRYTVKVTNVKSVDGVTKKSDSDSFTTKYDLAAPKISTAVAETNQRIVVTFNEEVDQESAENVANYSLVVDETDGAEVEIISVTWDDDDEDNVEIVTEAMEKREKYELSVNNIADQRKVANVMSRASKADIVGPAEDENGPKFDSVTVLSPTTLLVQFSDDSSIDEDSALDLNNYELEDLDIESIETVKDEWKLFRAKLTIEEMETGTSYGLTISDVLDEFGNAMKETKKPAKGISGSFASADLVSITATGENAVTVVFDKEVDETTAEDISNYDIDEGVGAPTKATLQDDGVTVKLEVNDLVNGYGEYDMVIDGVEDLAGNELYFKKKVNTATVWDTTAPELEDADILDKYTVALTFDERVKYEDTVGSEAKLTLKHKPIAAATYDPIDVIYLDAKDIVDDGTVVEFSSATLLDPANTYSVVEVVYGGVDGGVKDLIGNPLLAAKITSADFEFEGITDEPEKPELDSYEQVNGTTFEVTMTRWVNLTDGDGDGSVGTVDATLSDSTTVTFNISVDEDVVSFELPAGLVEDEEYTFDFSEFIENYHGTEADNADTNTTTVLEGEYTDEDAPYIEDVVALDRTTIKVVFSEDIPVDAADTAVWTLKNYDLDSSITVTMGANAVSDDDGDNIIYLTTNKALESRYEYELKLTKGTATVGVFDYVGLVNAEEEIFYFDGTNLASH